MQNAAIAELGLQTEVLLMPRLQAQFALAAGPVGHWAQERTGGLSGRGLGGPSGALWLSWRADGTIAPDAPGLTSRRCTSCPACVARGG